MNTERSGSLARNSLTFWCLKRMCFFFILMLDVWLLTTAVWLLISVAVTDRNQPSRERTKVWLFFRGKVRVDWLGVWYWQVCGRARSKFDEINQTVIFFRRPGSFKCRLRFVFKVTRRPFFEANFTITQQQCQPKSKDVNRRLQTIEKQQKWNPNRLTWESLGHGWSHTSLSL